MLATLLLPSCPWWLRNNIEHEDGGIDSKECECQWRRDTENRKEWIDQDEENFRERSRWWDFLRSPYFKKGGEKPNDGFVRCKQKSRMDLWFCVSIHHPVRACSFQMEGAFLRHIIGYNWRQAAFTYRLWNRENQREQTPIMVLRQMEVPMPNRIVSSINSGYGSSLEERGTRMLPFLDREKYRKAITKTHAYQRLQFGWWKRILVR